MIIERSPPSSMSCHDNSPNENLSPWQFVPATIHLRQKILVYQNKQNSKIIVMMIINFDLTQKVTREFFREVVAGTNCDTNRNNPRPCSRKTRKRRHPNNSWQTFSTTSTGRSRAPSREMEPASTTPTLTTPPATAPLTARDVDADVLPLVYEIIRRYQESSWRHWWPFPLPKVAINMCSFQCRAWLPRQR